MFQFTNEVIWCVPQGYRRYRKNEPVCFYVYVIILYAAKKLYVGYTYNPDNRLKSHISGCDQLVSPHITSQHDVQMFVIDKHNNKDTAKRFENLWMTEFGSVYPNGYNVSHRHHTATKEEDEHIRKQRATFLTKLVSWSALNEKHARDIFGLDDEEYTEYASKRKARKTTVNTPLPKREDIGVLGRLQQMKDLLNKQVHLSKQEIMWRNKAK